MLIGETSSPAITGMLRPRRDRGVFGHLEPEDKALGRGVEQLGPVLLARELVEGQVAADRRKGLGVFGEAFLLELGIGELAPRQVSTLAVDAADPAVVGPGD
jgi:hypothetical protein